MATFPLTSRMLEIGAGTDETISAGPAPGIGKLGLNSNGYQWTSTSTQSGQSFLQRISNAIVYSGSAANGNSNLSTVFQANQEAQVEFLTLPGSGNTVYIFLRIQNPGTASLNTYFFGLTDGATQTYIVGGLVNNSFITTIGSGNITGGNLATGDAFGGQVNGTTLSFWVRRSTVWTQFGGDFTNSQVAGTGQVGLETAGSQPATQLTNFIGGGSFEDAVGSLAVFMA